MKVVIKVVMILNKNITIRDNKKIQNKAEYGTIGYFRKILETKIFF